MFMPGSVFKIEAGDIPDAIGEMVENIHPDNRIMHYGYGMSLGVRI